VVETTLHGLNGILASGASNSGSPSAKIPSRED
jgi:hypothetical protein